MILGGRKSLTLLNCSSHTRRCVKRILFRLLTVPCLLVGSNNKNKETSMKLLILGSNGQVGHCLVDHAERKSLDFYATNSSQLDITDNSKVEEVFRQVNPSLVINATAYTNVEKAEDEPEKALDVNSKSFGNFANLFSQKNIPLIHISTDYVFDGTKDGYYQETDPVNPINSYGRSKLAGEKAIIDNIDKYIIIRTSWVFGRHGKNFVKTMLNLFRSRDELTVVSDQIGGPTFAGDIATAILKISEVLENSPVFSDWGIFNFSGKEDVNWFEFAKIIYEASRRKQLITRDVSIKPIPTSMFKTKAVRPQNSKLDLSKIKNVFDISASDWRSEIDNYIEHYLQ